MENQTMEGDCEREKAFDSFFKFMKEKGFTKVCGDGGETSVWMEE